VSTRTTGTGLVVVDSFQSLIASNEEAIQILAFPVEPNQMRRSWPLLEKKISSCLRNGHSGNGSGSVHEFRSGKRTYLCRSFTLKICGKEGRFSEAQVVLFQRKENNVATLSEACGRFGLTQREQETIHLLLQGLTSKEIAERMGISPNTVKAFLRLVMVKMGVSTRSAIVGKVLGPASKFGGHDSARTMMADC
jgi:DNA-binding CsgD family transcriptional regulator